VRRAVFSVLILASFAAVVAVGITTLSTPPKPATPAAPCGHQTFEGSAFTVCPVDPRTQDVKLVLTGKTGVPLRRFPALAAELGTARHTVRFAMNAGMYHASGAPVGLYIAHGTQKYPLQTGSGPRANGGNFFLPPNGVFSIDATGRFHVETTQDYAARTAEPAAAKSIWATQSGPMLVTGGHTNPVFQANGASRYLRNGVGLTRAGTAYFIISDTPVSFGRFARFFQTQLRCDDALYFDGAISSLWLPLEHRMDNGYDLGPMVVVTARQN
jgi:uncharacterized protein YigE (DUF2233 family)